MRRYYYAAATDRIGTVKIQELDRPGHVALIEWNTQSQDFSLKTPDGEAVIGRDQSAETLVQQLCQGLHDQRLALA